MKIKARHKQDIVTEKDFIEFLKLNKFRFHEKSSIMASKNRLNVSYHNDGYTILGETYPYPITMQRVANTFARWEPVWPWYFISKIEKEFDAEL